MHRLANLYHLVTEYILHKTVFALTGNEVDFFGLQEEDAPVADGTVIVYDRLLGRQRAFSYHMANRYAMRLPVGYRVHLIWQAILDMDAISPLAVVEHGRTFTPFGNYDRVPNKYQQLIAM